MNETIRIGLFSPADDSVIVRTSIYNWTGNNLVLHESKPGFFKGEFAVEYDASIRIEYKYVIKSNGQLFWEKHPNQENEPYGNRIFKPDCTQPDTFDVNRYHLCKIGQDILFSPEEVQADFLQFRTTLEREHCCLYEYTPESTFDSLFAACFAHLNHPMTPIEFFKALTPITARIGCGHTAVWMPDAFWDCGSKKLFPLKIQIIKGNVLADAAYEDSLPIPRGSLLQEINGKPVDVIIEEMQSNYSADAMNPHFIDSQIERRFPLLYARRFGFKDSFKVKYQEPGKTFKVKTLSPASQQSVRNVVFSNFNHPPLQLQIVDKETAVMKIPTFIYYDRVDYFTNFIDSCFTFIHDNSIKNLILDVRGNDGGDPFCAAPLFSYLQKKPQPYFAERYGKYSELAKPIPLPEHHFTGQLFTLIDGRCFSTNAHFCALLKYHGIGTFVGTPSGATYKCNAGKNTQVHLKNTGIMLYFGRSTFAAAVSGMDKTQPILPDIIVRQSTKDFLQGTDVFMKTVLELIKTRSN